MFSQIDAFCYPLDEGLTARRASILGCVQSGRPVVVSGPAEPDEFDHHPRFKELIDRGAVVLVGVARAAGLCRQDHLGPQVAVGADGLLFQRMVGGCRAGRSRATLKASMAGRLQ